MLVVFFRAIILYMLIIFCLRIMGKRQIGEMQPSDLVTTILISNMAALPIEDINIPMLVGSVPILVIAGSEIILTNLTLKFKRFRRLVTGKPIMIVENGTIDQKAMSSLRLSIDDLQEAARNNNIFDLQDIQYAIVETNGKISFLEKFPKQKATNETLSLKGEDKPLPYVIISDGKAINESLEKVNLSESWIRRTLKQKKLKVEDIFLMTADINEEYYIVPKG